VALGSGVIGGAFWGKGFRWDANFEGSDLFVALVADVTLSLQVGMDLTTKSDVWYLTRDDHKG